MNFNTHIFSVGNSQAIRIPKKLLEFLGFHTGDQVSLSVDDQAKSIIIKKAVPDTYKSIRELFAGYHSSGYIPSEWDTGELLGKEISQDV